MKKLLFTVILLGGLLQAEEQKLRYVIDGDTVVFANTTCRLAYIDTPESKFNRKLQRDISHSNISADEVIKAGRISKNYLKSILRKGSTYTFDVITKDKYQRSICVIYDHGGMSISHRVVKNGMAIPFWRYVRGTTKREMIALVRSAKLYKKGLWRAYPDVLEMMNH